MHNKQKYFDLLNSYFDKIYVITIERAAKRREVLAPLLDGLQYSYFLGMDKTLLEKDPNLLKHHYCEKRSINFHRYSKPMTIGHVACSLSHRMVYEDMVRNQYKNALIFEDDVVPDMENLSFIPNVLAELPPNWDMIYWGYDKNGTLGWRERTKQIFYHGLHGLQLLKWNHKMIKNLHSKPYSQHLKKAGYHDLLHAYSLSLNGAEKMIKLQTPIAFNADPAVAYAVANGWLNAFVTNPMIFLQEIQIHPDTYHSLIKD